MKWKLDTIFSHSASYLSWNQLFVVKSFNMRTPIFFVTYSFHFQLQNISTINLKTRYNKIWYCTNDQKYLPKYKIRTTSAQIRIPTKMKMMKMVAPLSPWFIFSGDPLLTLSPLYAFLHFWEDIFSACDLAQIMQKLAKEHSQTQRWRQHVKGAMSILQHILIACIFLLLAFFYAFFWLVHFLIGALFDWCIFFIAVV